MVLLALLRHDRYLPRLAQAPERIRAVRTGGRYGVDECVQRDRGNHAGVGTSGERAREPGAGSAEIREEGEALNG